MQFYQKCMQKHLRFIFIYLKLKINEVTMLFLTQNHTCSPQYGLNSITLVMAYLVSLLTNYHSGKTLKIEGRLV